jgi:hypothetical protein
MTVASTLPVRYVLYTHYPEGDDFKEYRRRGTPPRELPGVQFLVSHLTGLRGLLTWPGYEGLIVLFYAPGFAECLRGIASRMTETDLVRKCRELEFARAVDTYLHGLLAREHRALLPRLRFVTPLDLHKVFGRMKNSRIADHLGSWIMGDAEDVKYDSPKIVEAIVRLRLLGSGTPVFRVDYDVLFRGEENKLKKNLEFSSTVGSCLTAYQLRRDSPNLSSFIFSASYDHHALLDPKAAGEFQTWGRAFATRVFPALPVTKALIRRVRKAKPPGDTWDKYANDSFSPALARRFFGFEGDRFEVSRTHGVGLVGAHPMASVISGAMLYLSDGAILDLPPFSNFSLNVSWIDDHLKYCLHRELRHLSRAGRRGDAAEAGQNPLLVYSKIDSVIVQKAGRKVGGDFLGYIFNGYLPTMLRGAIMDAWITPHPLLKYRWEELTREERTALGRLLRGKQSQSVLASALQTALEEGDFVTAEETALKKRLEEVALRRINEVRTQWMALTEDGTDTFASLWAKGEAQSCLKLTLEYPGIVNPALVRADQSVTRITALDGKLITDLNELVNDAMEYIKWTLNWPTIVQVVRSIEQGTLRTDLNFDPEREDRT